MCDEWGGQKHTLRFDPRTELLLLVLANIVAFTQHSVWVEITWVVFLLLLIVACGCQNPQANWQSHLNLSGAAILCIPKRAKNFSQQLHDHCVLCKKDFPLFDCRYDGFTENARPGIDGCASKMAYPAGIDYSFVCNRPVLPSLERRNRLYSRCHEAPQYSWNAKIECLLVPTMISATTTAEELSAAAVTRGIENPAPKTSMIEMKFGVQDFVCLAIGVAFA